MSSFEPMDRDLLVESTKWFNKSPQTLYHEGNQYKFKICRMNEYQWMVQRTSLRDGASELAVWSGDYMTHKIRTSKHLPYVMFLQSARHLRY